MSAHPREHDPRITVIQRELFDERKSKARRYAELVVGEPGLWALVKFELIMLVVRERARRTRPSAAREALSAGCSDAWGATSPSAPT